MVTAFKCLEVIDAGMGSPDDAYAALFRKCNTFRMEGAYGESGEEIAAGYLSFFLDYRKETARIFRVFPAEKQNALAGKYYFLAGLMRPDDLDPALAEVIAKTCPIARQLLPDEYILRYGLRRDPLRRDCTRCEQCSFRNLLIL